MPGSRSRAEVTDFEALRAGMSSIVMTIGVGLVRGKKGRRTSGWRRGRVPRGSRRSRLDYWQASHTSGFVGAVAGFGLGVKLVSLETVAWRMRVAGRERR